MTKRDPHPEWTWEPRYSVLDFANPIGDPKRAAWGLKNPNWGLKLVPDPNYGHYTGGSAPFQHRWVYEPQNGNHNFQAISANVWPEYPIDGGGVSWEVDAISSWGDELHDFSAFDTKSVEEAKRFVDTLLTNYFNEVYDSVDWDA